MSHYDQDPNQHKLHDGSLPPLEPTAEVPMQHRDDVNTPEYIRDKFDGPTARVPREHRDDKHENTGLGWKKPVAAGVAVLAAVGVGIGIGSRGGDNTTEPKAEPSASAPVTPGQSPAETTPTQEAVPSSVATSETEVATGPVELSAERYKDGDALIRAFATEQNNWMMSGATPEVSEDEANYNLSRDEYVNKVAEPLDNSFTDALFVSDWQSRPQLAEYVRKVTDIHHAIVAIYLSTDAGSDPADKEPYRRNDRITSVGVISESPSQMVVNYRYEVEDNSDQNRADSFYGKSVDGITGGTTVTFKNIDGAWKVVDAKYFAG